MDKYEYNVKSDEIKKLYSHKNFEAAASIADEIDWYKVKDNTMINRVADIYENTKQYEKAKEILLIAYERSPLGRQLAYKLTILALRTKNFVEADEFYQDFVEMSPSDVSQYLLKYRIAKAKGEDIEVLIQILEAYVDVEMDERWQYELAKLYHEAGRDDKCVQMCNELEVWFNDGKYVNKAKELKRLITSVIEEYNKRYSSEDGTGTDSGYAAENSYTDENENTGTEEIYSTHGNHKTSDVDVKEDTEYNGNDTFTGSDSSGEGVQENNSSEEESNDDLQSAEQSQDNSDNRFFEELVDLQENEENSDEDYDDEADDSDDEEEETASEEEEFSPMKSLAETIVGEDEQEQEILRAETALREAEAAAVEAQRAADLAKKFVEEARVRVNIIKGISTGKDVLGKGTGKYAGMTLDEVRKQLDEEERRYESGETLDSDSKIEIFEFDKSKEGKGRKIGDELTKTAEIDINEIKLNLGDNDDVYNTANIQQALARSMAKLMGGQKQEAKHSSGAAENVNIEDANEDYLDDYSNEPTKRINRDEINRLLNDGKAKYHTVPLSPFLDQEEDGQIGIAEPQKEEEQIEGQMTIDDVLENMQSGDSDSDKDSNNGKEDINGDNISTESTVVENVSDNGMNEEGVSEDHADADSTNEENIDEESISGDSTGADNTIIENVSEDNGGEESVSKDDTDVESVSRDNADVEDVSRDNTDAEDVSRDNADVEDVSKNNTDAEDVSKDNTDAEDVSRDNTDAEDVSRDNTDAEDVSKNNADVEDVSKNNTDAEDVSKNNTDAEGVSDDSTSADNTNIQESNRESVSEADVNTDNTITENTSDRSVNIEAVDENSSINEKIVNAESISTGSISTDSGNSGSSSEAAGIIDAIAQMTDGEALITKGFFEEKQAAPDENVSDEDEKEEVIEGAIADIDLAQEVMAMMEQLKPEEENGIEPVEESKLIKETEPVEELEPIQESQSLWELQPSDKSQPEEKLQPSEEPSLTEKTEPAKEIISNAGQNQISEDIFEEVPEDYIPDPYAQFFEEGNKDVSNEETGDVEKAENVEENATTGKKGAGDSQKSEQNTSDNKENVVEEKKVEEKSEPKSDEYVNEGHKIPENYRTLFDDFVSTETMEESIADTLDNLINQFEMDGTSKTNNVIITGSAKSGKTTLGLSIIKAANRGRGRSGRKVAKVKATVLNKRGVALAMTQILGTDLIIEQAGNLMPNTIVDLMIAMKNYTEEMLIVLEDDKAAIDRMLISSPDLKSFFNNRLDIEEMEINDMVRIAKEYAASQFYEVDEIGELALYAKLDDISGRNPVMSIEDIQEVIDDAIEHARRFSIGKIFGKMKKGKGDKEILSEQDFL